jgi:2-dehydro-3-deoxyphosphooctonate aldolase (KDO 8-P synthase)
MLSNMKPERPDDENMNKQRHVKVSDDVTIGNDLPFALIAGPCQLENREHALEMAASLVDTTKKLDIPYVFKTSYDKANRTSINSKRGVGLEKALPIFKEIRDRFGCPILTDVHTEEQCGPVSTIVDILQIPAFLCRQTDLVVAMAKTGKTVNVKKGQFLSPWDVKNVVGKIEGAGNIDARSIPIMSKTGYPTVIDATHAVQQPGGLGSSTGGQREMAPVIARSAVSNGVGAVFIETHNDPDNAPSDGPNMIPLDQMYDLLNVLQQLDEVAKRNPINL